MSGIQTQQQIANHVKRVEELTPNVQLSGAECLFHG
jgi:hypothetical protein